MKKFNERQIARQNENALKKVSFKINFFTYFLLAIVRQTRLQSVAFN